MFAVIGSDHDYDQGSQWLVGVFSTRAIAEAASKDNRHSYKGWIDPSEVVYDITECELDTHVVRK